MRIAIVTTIQNSAFSGGVANLTLALSELLGNLGHTAEIVHLSSATWWDDCTSIREAQVVKSLAEATQGPRQDLCLEVDTSTLSSKEERDSLSPCSIWVIRRNPTLFEIENSLQVLQPKVRNLDGIAASWILDANSTPEDRTIIETLTRAPCITVPYLWTPSFVEAHHKEIGAPSWMHRTLSDLSEKGGKLSPWKVHMVESNMSNGSSFTLPLVITQRAKTSTQVQVEHQTVHNANQSTCSPFFKSNLLKHLQCEGLSGEFVGRQRCVEWVFEPMSCVVSHLRFQRIKPVLLDLAWSGIPLIHNSPLLQEIGGGLEGGQYPDNEIVAATEAFQRVQEDLISLRGMFTFEALTKLRTAIQTCVGPSSSSVQKGWSAALEKVGGLVKANPVSPPPVKADTIRIVFCDMWENFSPAQNFFTLLLTSAGVSVQGLSVEACANPDLIVFGPFGQQWKSQPSSIPKIHFTGENTAPVAEAQLNLGFQHVDQVGSARSQLRFPLWLLEIDWFGADLEKIQNPKPIPLERCTTVVPEELARKKKFCAFVVSNPNNPIRNSAYHWLNEQKTVDSAGRLFNTMGDILAAGLGGGGGEIKKFEFLKDQKFCLTFENSSAPGQTTEKQLHAKAAGCIPIYWGDPKFERDFSIEGCIDARGIKNPEDLIALVKKVDEDPSLWLKKQAVPALDAVKVDWARQTLAELAKRMVRLAGRTIAIPDRLPAPATAVAPVASPPSAPAPAPASASAPAPASVPAVAPAPAPVSRESVVPAPLSSISLEVPVHVTFMTSPQIQFTQVWLTSLQSQIQKIPSLTAHVFHTSDLSANVLKEMKEKYPFVKWRCVKDTWTPPNFPDFWNPDHQAWKLWIFHTLANDPELLGKMIFYMDAGIFVCRWPLEWLAIAQKEGISFLEDSTKINTNARWSHEVCQKEMAMTPQELEDTQILGGIAVFRAGHPKVLKYFEEAFTWGQKREVIVGDKWNVVDGKRTLSGHRHDQTILSILSSRHKIPRYPQEKVCASRSVRDTFLRGKSLYLHRGIFKFSVPWAKKIDDAFVINLDRRQDRIQKFYSMDPTFASTVYRLPAQDGRQLTLTPALARLFAPNDFQWKKSVMGCALSHLELWWKLVHDHPDVKTQMVFEDDVKLTASWKESWEEAADHIPEDFDIVQWGGILPPNKPGQMVVKERVNAQFSRIGKNNLQGQKPENRQFHTCNYSYIIHRRAAEKVLSFLQAKKGQWTSADHMICNLVELLNMYQMDPLTAGCQQDDDPKQAASEFNNFNRVDQFDSDLWNNDERFTEAEIASVLCEEDEIDIPKALADARKISGGATPKEVTATQKAPAAAAPEAPPATPTKYVTEGTRRFVVLDNHDLTPQNMQESDWIQELLGDPSIFAITQISPSAPPPKDHPIVIVQRGHEEPYRALFERWNEWDAPFSILHISDEHGNSDISYQDLSSCKQVIRMQERELTPTAAAKTLTIPLGYHFSPKNGHQDPRIRSPNLPFRSHLWSFQGTNWAHRDKLLAPLITLPEGLTYKAQFQETWCDPSGLQEKEQLSTLLDSVFVPCPSGQNGETQRLQEALECGAIPVVVEDGKNEAFLQTIQKELQILPLKSWEEARKFMLHLWSEKELLEAYRTTILGAQMEWKAKLRTAVSQRVT